MTRIQPGPSARGGSRAAHGFTLLEVILAVTIFAIVATAIYGTFSRTLRSKGIAEARMDVVRTGRMAVTRIADEITSAANDAPQVTGARKFFALRDGGDDAPLDSIAFWTYGSRGGPEDFATDQRMVEYFFPTDTGGMRRRSAGTSRTDASGLATTDARVTTGGASTALDDRRRDDDVVDLFAAFGADRLRERGIAAERLLRRESLLIQTRGDENTYASVFLDNVASLRFRFCDGTDWLDAWDSDDRINYPAGMPRAVAIDLGLYDEDGAVHHFATAVDLVAVKRRGDGTCPPWDQDSALRKRTR